MVFSWVKRGAKKPDPLAGLHAVVVAAALDPGVYLAGGVADSFEGRFESVTLHAWLVTRRLGTLPPPGPDAAQELVDRIFAGLDHTLRELGVGDVVVPRKMKLLASSFLGRLEAYEAALSAGNRVGLRAALSRNALDGRSAEALASFVEQATPHLDTLSLDDILGSAPLFPQWSAP